MKMMVNNESKQIEYEELLTQYPNIVYVFDKGKDIVIED